MEIGEHVVNPSPHIVVMELFQPGCDVDGVELTRWLRQDDRTKTVPLILLSARVRADDFDRAEVAGADR